MYRFALLLVAAALVVFSARGLLAEDAPADNTLTEKEKADGWVLLFNGTDFTGWRNNNGKPITSQVKDGAIQIHKCGGYVLMYDKPFGDFTLVCDVKQVDAGANSGIFFRVGNAGDPVQTGFEAQVEKGGTGIHSFGAIYDLVPAKVDASKPGEWNRYELTCVGPRITVKVNGQVTAEMNTDEWPEPGKRPDGSKHKFRAAMKDMPRVGLLGFQDHGQQVLYKNVKLLDLTGKGG